MGDFDLLWVDQRHKKPPVAPPLPNHFAHCLSFLARELHFAFSVAPRRSIDCYGERLQSGVR